MAHIHLDSVSVEFPVYDSHARSLKNKVVRFTTGGRLMQDANKHVMVKALDNLSLELEHGDRVALVGHNGAGKSTFLKLVAGIYEPSLGTIKVDGAISPMLNLMQGIEAEFTGIENIKIRGTMLGLTKAQIEEKMAEIIDFSELEAYIHMPVRTYSAGMMVRLAFSIATSIHPEILLIDEVFGAGDTKFMEKAHKKMTSLLDQASIVIFASHADTLVKEFCNKAILLQNGRVVEIGPVAQVLEHYHHLNQ